MYRQLTKTLILLMAVEAAFIVMLLLVAMLSTNRIILALMLVELAVLLLTIYIDIREIMRLAREIDNAALQRTEAISRIIDNELRTNENFHLLAKAVKSEINPEEETEEETETTSDNDRQ